MEDYSVEGEYISVGIIAATATPDGNLICIDFANIHDSSRALRLAFPSSELEIFQEQLSRLQKALADPQSGIRFSGLAN